MLEIVNSTKSSDIPAAVKAISLDQRDALMKYLYKGLEVGGGAHLETRKARLPRCQAILKAVRGMRKADHQAIFGGDQISLQLNE